MLLDILSMTNSEALKKFSQVRLVVDKVVRLDSPSAGAEGYCREISISLDSLYRSNNFVIYFS